MPVVVSAPVESATDEAVARRLILHVGAEVGTVHGKNGKPHFRERIRGYNNAARHSPWLVLVDLDQDENCAPPLRASWIPAPARQLCFRVSASRSVPWRPGSWRMPTQLQRFSECHVRR